LTERDVRTRLPVSSLAVQNDAPKQRPDKLSDGDGWCLRVEGSKIIRRFRYRFGGKEPATRPTCARAKTCTQSGGHQKNELAAPL
jgi:hypothetical protein